MTLLCIEELERFKNDLKEGNFICVAYLDTWEYEDDYSHNEIRLSRKQFIKEANKILEQNKSSYIMKEICERAIIYNKYTGEIAKE